LILPLRRVYLPDAPRQFTRYDEGAARARHARYHSQSLEMADVCAMMLIISFIAALAAFATGLPDDYDYCLACLSAIAAAIFVYASRCFATAADA
jgi:hypothetical protein